MLNKSFVLCLVLALHIAFNNRQGLGYETYCLMFYNAVLDDRRYSTELIYSGSDEDYDFEDDRKQQEGTGER